MTTFYVTGVLQQGPLSGNRVSLWASDINRALKIYKSNGLKNIWAEDDITRKRKKLKISPSGEII